MESIHWTCPLLQETHTEPWGTLHAAVQESLELAEAVDMHALPGLHRLWKKHDLNVQGDANHFVNTLWNLSQSRAFHYRYAEIKPGGYLVCLLVPQNPPIRYPWSMFVPLVELLPTLPPPVVRPGRQFFCAC